MGTSRESEGGDCVCAIMFNPAVTDVPEGVRALLNKLQSPRPELLLLGLLGGRSSRKLQLASQTQYSMVFGA